MSMTNMQQDDVNASSTRSSSGPGARAGYCQECGLELTAESLRRVGDGVFCGSCAAWRQPGTGWQQVRGAYAGAQPGAAPPRNSGAPNPAVAAFLGFIPGVGAMYNAQFAKGAMHLIVFVVLVALADNLNWVFWWLVWGWIFYQAFEAYHTARARRDALPLPNPFGWNDLGERMGFPRSTSSASSEPWRSSPASAGSGRADGANWAGYVPPRDPAHPPYSPFAEHPGENPYATPYAPASPPPAPATPPTTVPYTPTYTGPAPQDSSAAPRLVGSTKRFPLGAAWLIGLGILFLLGNLLPELRLTGQWFVPILLAALAFWTGVRRWEMLQNSRANTSTCSTFSCALTGPVVLLTISLLLALQSAHLVGMHRSWPVLLVVWGTMLLLQRSAGTSATTPPQGAAEPVPPVRSTSGTGALGL